MKKIISLVLALVMLCGAMLALTSCGGSETIVSKVGLQKGTTSKMYADLLKGVEVVTYDTFALAAKDMKNGNVDYVIVDKSTARAICAEVDGLKIIENIPLSSENYGISMRLSTRWNITWYSCSSSCLQVYFARFSSGEKCRGMNCLKSAF